MGGLPKSVDKSRTITNMSYPTCDIQRSKEVVRVIQEMKVRKTFFSLVFVTISGRISFINFLQDEKLNALAMDKGQYPLAMYNIKSSK
jgi:hypothetical protein